MSDGTLILSDREFEQIRQLVVKLTGNAISAEKKLLVESRLRRLVVPMNVTFESYLKLVQGNAEHQDKFITALTTHKTDWFREPAHFEFLKNLVTKTSSSQEASWLIWSAACASGEEAYSAAMTLEEAGAKNYRLLGTDISRHHLEMAQKGIYPSEMVEQQVEEPFRKRYFNRMSGNSRVQYEIANTLRQKIKWRNFNLLNSCLLIDVQFDLIFLRNVLIYFDEKTAGLVVRHVLRYLRPGGHLILGMSESIFNYGDLGLDRLGSSIFQYTAAKQREATPTTSEKKGEAKRAPIRQIRVLIVDDSAVARGLMRAALSDCPEITVVGEAENGVQAERFCKEVHPDLITLDMNMPIMDGLTFFRRLMESNPLPVIIVSDQNDNEASPVVKCLELGAVDFMHKPSIREMSDFAIRGRNMIIEGFRYFQKLKSSREESAGLDKTSNRETKAKNSLLKFSPDIELVAIGASTGGTYAIREVLKNLPSETPPILIVQHLPGNFSQAFADSLNDASSFSVLLARHGMVAEKNHAYLAPGGQQMRIQRNESGKLVIEITNDPPVNSFRPSVDYLFKSIALNKIAANTSAVLMTGMGSDGALGMIELRSKGATTFVQDEKSCVVFGMPRAALEIGAANRAVPLAEIAITLLRPFK